VRAPLFIFLATLACCGCRDKTSPGEAGSATAANLTAEQASQVLAKVGDKTITLGDFAAALEHMDSFSRLRYQSPERRKELLNEMINVQLLADEAVEKGYDKDPVAEQELRMVLRDVLLREIRQTVPSPSELPEADVRAYYDAHRGDFKDPERRRLSLLVLPTEAAAKSALEEAKKASSATAWGELVRKLSVDPQAKAPVPVDLAGDFGMVSPPGDPRGTNPKIPEPVRVAGFEIGKVGEMLPRVVRAAGKFYLVRLTQKSEAHDRTFLEVERTLRIKLAQELLRAKEDDLLAELRKRYPVTIDEASLAQIRVAPADAGKD
jgi:parvulin-like peptidyl-prolyl isomerase